MERTRSTRPSPAPWRTAAPHVRSCYALTGSPLWQRNAGLGAIAGRVLPAGACPRAPPSSLTRRPAGMGLLGLLTLLACLSPGGRAKIFTRCELAQVLKDGGMDGYEGYSLANWVCLAFYESGFDTAAVGTNPDGSADYGIFQINSGWWCQDAQGASENLCHVHCQDLLNPDIQDDISCAKRVVQDPLGMESWNDWKNHCEKQDLTEWVQGCGV